MESLRRTTGHRVVLASLASAVAVAGCDAILGLGEEPNEGITTTTSGQPTGATTSSVGSSGGGTTGGGSTSETTSSGGGDGGAGPVTASAGSVGGGGSGAGGGEDCADPQPVPLDCGSCAHLDCARCGDDGQCAERFTVIPGTLHGADDPGSLLNRYSRGVVVAGGEIVFTRNVGGGPVRSNLVVVRSDGGVDSLELDSDIYALAADPAGEAIVLSGADQATLFLVDTSFAEPQIGAIDVTIPARGFGAITWQAERRFVGALRDSAAPHLVDLALERGSDSCLLANVQASGSAVSVAHGMLFDEASSTVALRIASAHYDSADLTVETLPSVDVCPDSPPVQTESVLVGPDVSLTLGIALACNDVYAQAADPSATGGILTNLRSGYTAGTHPSPAIAANGERIYAPGYNGGVLLCDRDLDCDPVVVMEDLGIVSLLHATRRGFVSVGTAEPDEDGLSDTIVACVNHLP